MTTKVAIDAQLMPRRATGGIRWFLIGLVTALGQLDDGGEEYIIIGPWEEPDWLEPYLGPNQRIVPGPMPPHVREQPSGLSRLFEPALIPLQSLARWMWRKLFPALRSEAHRWPEVPVSNGFYENLGCDVIHFPHQKFVLCALPAIYNPHDLQHLHYPQFFRPSVIAWRETVYPAGCRMAHTVVMMSHWGKQDLVRHYSVHPDKVQVIPGAPPMRVYPEPTPEEQAEVQTRYGLRLPFALYPATTWEHKNHIRLLEALAHLRHGEGLMIPLVCTGERYLGFWPRIEERLATLDLNDQVKFLGMIPSKDLRAVYRLAQFVIFPSLFEGGALPVFEAWSEGAPLACSTATVFPELAGDAALLFDPYSVQAIADAVRRMATESELREDLCRRGAQRLQLFDWERIAKAYRAVYRRAARCPLTDEDLWLLNRAWTPDTQSHLMDKA